MDDAEYEDYLHELGPLKHEPMHRARQGHIGEMVFLELWQAFMATSAEHHRGPNVALAVVLGDLPTRITQRHATIAASVVTWLAAACGRCCISEARSMEAKGIRDAYTAAWAVQNRRCSFVNYGFRTLEHLLAPETSFGKNYLTGLPGLFRRPELSADDYETAEHLWHWLGTYEGKAFVEMCEREVDVRERSARDLSRFTQNSSGDRHT